MFIDARLAAHFADEMEQLVPMLGRLGHTLTAPVRATLVAYVSLVAQWNRRVHLVSRRDVARLVTRHVAESLALLGCLPEGSGSAVLDLGAGAGLPSLPLKIARPDLRVWVVESNRKKSLFLQEAVESLGLEDCMVVRERAEVLGRGSAHRGRYQVVTARAVAPLAKLLPVAVPLLSRRQPPGRLLVPRGRENAVVLQSHDCVCTRSVFDLQSLELPPLSVLVIQPVTAAADGETETHVPGEH